MKLYSWLRTVIGEEGGDICSVKFVLMGGILMLCIGRMKIRTFRTQPSLSRHADLDEHKMLLQAPKLRSDMNIVLKKGDSKKDAAATVFLKLVHSIG